MDTGKTIQFLLAIPGYNLSSERVYRSYNTLRRRGHSYTCDYVYWFSCSWVVSPWLSWRSRTFDGVNLTIRLEGVREYVLTGLGVKAWPPWK